MNTECVHGACVAVGSRGLLILGPSGAGKSRLALEMMAFGASLVSDDQTILRREGGRLTATAPDALRGVIEARGVGLLRAVCRERAEVSLVIDLGEAETQRLPPRRLKRLLGVDVPLILRCEASMAPILMLVLRCGPPHDPDGDLGA